MLCLFISDIILQFYVKIMHLNGFGCKISLFSLSVIKNSAIFIKSY